jgi:hypothetical protein
MERGETKLRFRTPTRGAQFKFPSEGRLKILLIISIWSFPNHSNIRRNLSGVAKTALEGERPHTFVCSSLLFQENAYIFNTNLKTFYAQLFTLWPTFECYITRAEHVPKIQLPRIALPKTTMFPIMECWYPADGLMNRCYKNSQKNQEHCTCSFVLFVVIYCVCFFVIVVKLWLVKMNIPRPGKKEFLRDCQGEWE